MGITLHAIVERLIPESPYGPARWVVAGTWDDFGKHFALKEWLYQFRESTGRRWPTDSSATEDDENDVLSSRVWTLPGETDMALTEIRAATMGIDGRLVFVEPLEALASALRVYTNRGHQMRVLWGVT